MTLREAGVVLIDCEHRTPPPAIEGYPYITIPEMSDGRLNLEAARRITPDHFEEWTRKARPRAFDVVLSRRCNPGETAYVAPGAEFALGQNLVLLRSDGAMVYPPFLRWLARGPAWWEQIQKHLNVGAVFDSLRCADVPNFELPIAPIQVQRQIADVLGSLDDKIDLNRLMNATLESLAAAIFKAWFVDFEPVKAKAAGRPSFPGMPQATFDALPNTFEDSPLLGPVPKGWRFSTLSDECDFVMGQSPPSETYNSSGEGLPFHQGVGTFGTRFPEHETFCTVANRLAEPGDVLFSVRAPVGRINVADRKLIVGRGLAAVRHRQAWRSFLLYHLKHSFQVEDSMGSGTIYAAVNKDDVKGIPLLRPGPVTAQAYERIVSPVDALIASNTRESASVAALRDLLLPRLMSGELRLKGGAARR